MQPPDMRSHICGSAAETVVAEKPTATCCSCSRPSASCYVQLQTKTVKNLKSVIVNSISIYGHQTDLEVIITCDTLCIPIGYYIESKNMFIYVWS